MVMWSCSVPTYGNVTLSCAWKLQGGGRVRARARVRVAVRIRVRADALSLMRLENRRTGRILIRSSLTSQSPNLGTVRLRYWYLVETEMASFLTLTDHSYH